MDDNLIPITVNRGDVKKYFVIPEEIIGDFCDDLEDKKLSEAGFDEKWRDYASDSSIDISEILKKL